MRVISSVLFATLTCAVSHQTFGQPLKIDLAINGWGAIDHVQEILPAGSYAYGSGAIGLETKTSYFISGIGFSPFLHAHYHFPIFGIPTASEVDALVIRPNGWLLDFGVEKPFNIGYSTLALSFGVGVNWEEYKIDVPSAQSLSIRNDDIAYVAGIVLNLPFVKGLDVSLGYKFVHKAKRQIDYRTSNTTYRLDATNAHHLLSLGVSVKFLEDVQSD